MTATKKHPCPDCKMCQWCSDERCHLCLKTGCGKKMSMAEQIALYEKINRQSSSDLECPPKDCETGN